MLCFSPVLFVLASIRYFTDISNVNRSLIFILTFFLSFPIFQSLKSQSPADWWYFGDSAGVHFTPSGPVADTNGVLFTSEGVSTISDQFGNLLFYTDGIKVFDANHNLMPNGDSLMGNSSATQSAVIVPWPSNSTKYFVFTVEAAVLPEGFRYSIVDMSLNGGSGDIDSTMKNILVQTPSREKIAVTEKADATGYWIVTRAYGSDSIFVYDLTPIGLNLTPQVFQLGSSITSFSFVGYLRFSPSGNFLASANSADGSFELYKFNTSTGEVSDALEILTTYEPYGIEFSPNENYIYVTAHPGPIFQYDINTWTVTSMIGSETAVGIIAGAGAGAMALGPDSKIYIARSATYFLSCIQEPNQAGMACSYIDTSLFLQGRMSFLGLPTFVSSFSNVHFQASDFCFGSLTQFITDTSGIDSVLWNFGDPTSGVNNTSTLFQPNHQYTDTGSFTITLISQLASGGADTVFQTIYIYPRQVKSFVATDTFLCIGDTLKLDISQPFSTFLWNDSSVSNSLMIYNDSTTWVTVFGVCDTVSDSLSVHFQDSLFTDLGADTVICGSVSHQLNALEDSSAVYAWSTGDSSFMINVVATDQYYVSVINACGVFEDSINVQFIPLIDSTLLPEDSIHCFEDPVLLQRPDADLVNYVWSDSSSSLFFVVDTTVNIWLTAFNACDSTTDSFTVKFVEPLITELGEDTVLCTRVSIQLQGQDSLASYYWNTGDTTRVIQTDPEVARNYSVTVENEGCLRVESLNILLEDFACVLIGCELDYDNVFTPNGDGMNDVFKVDPKCNTSSFNLAIFNRWGQLVYEGMHNQFSWDGSIKGELATEGVYYFVATFKDREDVLHTQSGSVSLFRE